MHYCNIEIQESHISCSNLLFLLNTMLIKIHHLYFPNTNDTPIKKSNVFHSPNIYLTICNPCINSVFAYYFILKLIYSKRATTTAFIYFAELLLEYFIISDNNIQPSCF